MDKKAQILKIVADAIYLKADPEVVTDRILLLCNSSLQLKENKRPTFEEWRISEGYKFLFHETYFKDCEHYSIKTVEEKYNKKFKQAL